MPEQSNATLKHLLNDPLPDKIYCETSFFVSSILRDREDRHTSCLRFIERLIEKKTIVFFNTIVYYEGYIAFIKNILDRAGRSRNLYLAQPEQLEPYKEIIKEDYNRMVNLIKSLHTLQIKSDDVDIINSVLQSQVLYRLDPADAFHIGTLIFSGEINIASFDINHFRPIPNINLWCKHF